MPITYSEHSLTEEFEVLQRRGITFGWVRQNLTETLPSPQQMDEYWHNCKPIYLPQILSPIIPDYEADIVQAQTLLDQLLETQDLAGQFDTEPYAEKLEANFSNAGLCPEENDVQAIDKVIFDVWEEDELVADNLWCKASWLSFDDEDFSLRFRFSFGMEGYEVVSEDRVRQQWASNLAETIFPECGIVSNNKSLNALLAKMLHKETFKYAERIIYFNAPNGGAQMHHDCETGHDGVLFAQMSGATFWLALSKADLIVEIYEYLKKTQDTQWADLIKLAESESDLSNYLNNPEHELAEQLIDHNPEFLQQLVEKGYSYILRPGDVLLLPQHSLENCVWHSVMCLGAEIGEGLSFAINSNSGN